MSSNLHILFVEDQAIDAELCEHELRKAGVEFTSDRVCTRVDFERAVAESPPDLILSDFSMPTDLDGFAALALARDKAADVPFVFVSGTIGEERAVAAMKAGATDYVLKDRLERLPPVVTRAVAEARDKRAMLDAQDALRASEATFRSFMQHLPGRASIRDLGGRYTYVNGLWQESHGLAAQDVVGRPCDEVLDSELAQEVKAADAQVVSGNAPVKHVVRRGAGERAKWWLAYHFPIPGPGAVPALVGTIAIDITEQKLQEEKLARLIDTEQKLAYLAWHDPLTGLGNRALLHQRLGEAVGAASHGGAGTAVLVWDVKRFSTVNDSLGRDAGDGLLRELSRRLARLWPELSDMARLSADTFGGLIRDGADAPRVAHLLERSAAALTEPFVVYGTEITIDICVGIALCPADGADADTLLANTEAALKQAKARGERYLFYQADMNARVAERLSLEGRLRRALEREQFFLHYEPKIDLQTGRVSGLEALIRWNDPEGGIVPPQEFVPVLEETGLILEVGHWAIHTALEHWKERAARARGAQRIAVNVSALQLRRSDFVETVGKALADCADGRHGLDLEITESLLMQDIEANTRKLRALKEMGVNIAIDDFGTGYSSLSYLARLPADALKIDASFIRTMMGEPQSMTIVSTIISLAHTLRMCVVAEGVETSEQANLLRDLRCDQAQGYFFSRPEEAALS